MKRTTITVAGESGMGQLSTGDIICKALKRLGYFVFADREYPSLIKGGHATFQINFSEQPINSLVEKIDILIAVDEAAIRHYTKSIKPGGILIHGHERSGSIIYKYEEYLKENNIQTIHLPAREIAASHGGSALMTNMVLLGLLWKIFGFKIDKLREEVEERFADKPKLLEIDLKCLESGYKAEKYSDPDPIPHLNLPEKEKIPNKILLNGNYAIALGALAAGMRNYYAYPMSPSSSILTYIAATYHQSKVVLKQAEDEITAIQMAIGSMFAGSRALVATSGGGFDLMTESVSLAGMIECPLVVVIVQRPGPATGLPTWTAQGDVNLAIHSAHGEYPKIVMSCSDSESAYLQIQRAFNLAEKFQTPVIFLSDKHLAEAQTMVDKFDPKAIKIERHLVTDQKELDQLESSDRYKITESGISKRWNPGSKAPTYFANGDEHWEDGTLTEDADKSKEMISKRIRKEKAILEDLPEPEVFGEEKDADISFIGWGSSKLVILDAIKDAEKEGIKVNYLHYENLWPFKKDKAISFFENNQNVHLIEGNHNGQFGEIIENKTKKEFKKKYLKWNGRPFFIEEVNEYIKENSA